MRVAVVIPTIRDLSFLRSWAPWLRGTTLYIVEDHPQKQLPTPKSSHFSVRHYCWQDIDRDFGKDAWIFPRQNAGIRSYGFWKAHGEGADIIITLDDDCFPLDKNFVADHVANLSMKAPEKWFPTFPDRRFLFTRGFPYSVRDKYPVVISHGLWMNNIDFDAQTQLQHPGVSVWRKEPMTQFVPFGYYFPMCSMNLAFRREATPLMYFPLMGKDPDGKPWGYDRFDDIWAGLFAKKICDHLGLAVVNGSPFVEHRRASDPRKNLEKERKGIRTNETLWRVTDALRLAAKSPAECVTEMARKIHLPNETYFFSLRKALFLWAKLYR